MQDSDEVARLTELAGRLIGGHVRLGALPDEFAGILPLPPGARLLGSVSYGGGDPSGLAVQTMGTNVQALLDAPGDAAELVSFFEAALAPHGWQVPEEQQRYRDVMARAGRLWLRHPDRRMLSLSVEPGAGDRYQIRLVIMSTPTEAETDEALTKYARVPRLTPSDRITSRGGGGIGSGGRYMQYATAVSSVGPADLEAEFGRQLSAGGWVRRDGGGELPVVWSRWSIPAEPEVAGWLVLLDGRQPREYLVVLGRDGPPESDFPPLRATRGANPPL